VLGEFGIDAWRLQRGGHPLDAKSYPKGKYRFDAPGGEYPAPLYANTLRLGCFAEVFGDAGVIEAAEIRRRSLFRLRSTRALQLLRLQNGGVQKAFRLDSRICDTKVYALSQAWGLAFHEWYPDADGIRYISRHASPGLNVCLFLDRCVGAITAENVGPLTDLRRTVAAARRKYHLDSQG
jgi:hypothetical protein